MKLVPGGFVPRLLREPLAAGRRTRPDLGEEVGADEAVPPGELVDPRGGDLQVQVLLERAVDQIVEDGVVAAPIQAVLATSFASVTVMRQEGGGIYRGLIVGPDRASTEGQGDNGQDEDPGVLNARVFAIRC